MSSLSSDRVDVRSGGRGLRWTVIKEVWGTIAIVAMWLAVLFDSVYGDEVVSTNSPTTETRIPSAVFVAFFAFLATAAVAKRAFSQWSSPE